MKDSRESEIIDYLTRAVKRDDEKGGSGWRTTREAADYLGLKVAAARIRLEALFADKKIKGGRDGNLLLWRAL